MICATFFFRLSGSCSSSPPTLPCYTSSHFVPTIIFTENGPTLNSKNRFEIYDQLYNYLIIITMHFGVYSSQVFN